MLLACCQLYVMLKRHCVLLYSRWGYTNSNYANKQGPQMAFTQALINAITGQ